MKLKSTTKLIEADINYLAGFLDGDGSIMAQIVKGDSYRYGYTIRVTVCLRVWLITVAVIVLAFSLFGGDLLGWKKGVYIMLRSFFILMLWYLIIGPLLLKLVRKYLIKKESQYEEDITNAMDLFPYFRQIILYTLKETKDLKGYTRFKYFIANSISNCIHFKIPSQ